MVKVLIVEDHEGKITALKDILDIGYFDLTVAMAFKDAQKKILDFNFDLILLDMSIPTFDKSVVRGGSHRAFGGQDILEFMLRYNRESKVFIVSGYDRIGVGANAIPFWELRNKLKLGFPKLVIGGTYFDPFENQWQVDIFKMLKREFNYERPSNS